ncbi:unnamed protein product [Heligmosomoides polygyrus]|uniref:C2H2-type domain-containing protein n=1 Tax=Heligmosomoides polygyrus TaxID=6339 RepID=A0A183GEM9_HELPZ|nr:unnamed protein product [Heligmosomoides polygyrus]
MTCTIRAADVLEIPQNSPGAQTDQAPLPPLPSVHAAILVLSYLLLMSRLGGKLGAAKTAAIGFRALPHGSASRPADGKDFSALADRGEDLEWKVMLIMQPRWQWRGAAKLMLSVAPRPLFITTLQFCRLPLCRKTVRRPRGLLTHAHLHLQ